MTLLSIEDLRVDLHAGGERRPVVDGLSLQLDAGDTVGLVGESGSGKSVTALSLLRLLPQPALNIGGGRIRFDGRDVLAMNSRELQQLRGNEIGMIFQDPMTALNPVQPIGRQIEEVMELHRPQWTARQRRQRTIELLGRIGMPSPAERLNAYPHQFSGGMRQRVMIAMALACEPKLLIADEPTTALDVTVQSQVLNLIRELQQQSGMAVLFITHDLGVVAQICRRVAVMYAGRVVEEATTAALLTRPSHPYSRGLLASLPALNPSPQTPLPAIAGQSIAAGQAGPGCRFAPRCAWRITQCEAEPDLLTVSAEHRAACWRWELFHE